MEIPVASKDLLVETSAVVGLAFLRPGETSSGAGHSCGWSPNALKVHELDLRQKCRCQSLILLSEDQGREWWVGEKVQSWQPRPTLHNIESFSTIKGWKSF